ncbi:hypothetical protein BO218_03555 [Microbacterium paludicola]|nr:hypothetical protein BO218_03555 [Microbacterium paludicola]
MFDVWVDVLETKLPQRFLTTSFSGSLADHLDLAVNSIGAVWYVDRFGVVQFTPPPEMLPVSHTFSDKRSDGVLEYTGIETVWDTQQTVNHLVIRNRSYGSAVKGEELPDAIRKTVKDGDAPKSEEKEAVYEWRDGASIAKYGERAAEVETNVALPDPFTERMRQEHPDWGIPVSDWQAAYDDLVAKLASNRTTPRLLVTSLTWNCQQDTDAARNFELGQRVRVFTRGFEQDAIITGIDHDISPERWNMILTLSRP